MDKVKHELQTLVWYSPVDKLPAVAKNGLSEPLYYQYKDANIFHATITEVGQYSDAPWCEKMFMTDQNEDRMVGADAVMKWAYINSEDEELSPTTPATGSAITSERLEEMSKDVDKALESETPESLQQFMDSQRTPATSWEEVFKGAFEHAQQDAPIVGLMERFNEWLSRYNTYISSHAPSLHQVDRWVRVEDVKIESAAKEYSISQHGKFVANVNSPWHVDYTQSKKDFIAGAKFALSYSLPTAPETDKTT